MAIAVQVSVSSRWSRIELAALLETFKKI